MHGNELTTKYAELDEAKSRIMELESRIKEMESRIPRKYPDVTFLNYKNRKRILVSISDTEI